MLLTSVVSDDHSFLGPPSQPLLPLLAIVYDRYHTRKPFDSAFTRSSLYATAATSNKQVEAEEAMTAHCLCSV